MVQVCVLCQVYRSFIENMFWRWYCTYLELFPASHAGLSQLLTATSWVHWMPVSWILYIMQCLSFYRLSSTLHVLATCKRLLKPFVTTREVACLSVCLSVRLSDDNFRKLWHRKFILTLLVHLQGIRVKFVYEGHRLMVKVTGAKKAQHPYSRNVKRRLAITSVL